MKTKLGSELHPEDRAHVLATFVHRFTGEHKPDWVRAAESEGKPYPVQFENDADWLANTRFPVRDDGRLKIFARYCESNPTWPHNPELRQ